MSVEFRQRKPGEYGRILWKRKWLIILPAIVVSFAVAIVVWRLPNVYQSNTLLTVRPSNIMQGIVPQMSDDDLTIRINAIGQEVFSRSSLEPLITTYNLYAAERRRGEPMELLVERMAKKDTQIEVNKSRNDITNGFILTFKGPDPSITQKVTGDLASKYVNAQLKQQSQGATETGKFLQQQLDLAQAELKTVEDQRLHTLQTNINNLPTQATSLVTNLSGLYEQQKSYISDIGRLRDQKTMLTTQLGDIEKQFQADKDDVVETLTDPKTTPAWAELSKRESQLDSELQNMLTVLKPKNPDVVAKRQELAAVQRSKQELTDDWKNRIADKTKRVANRIDPRASTIKANLQGIDNEVARQEKLLAQTSAQISQVQSQLSRVPGAEIDLGRIDREYQTKKAAYDELLLKKQKSDLNVAATNSAQGETIQVIDPASLPVRPIAPKRPLLIALGLALGLAFGFAFAAAFEVPRLLTIQTVEDARHYTGLPVLISVPELLTPKEQRRARVRRVATAFAGLAITVLSIPALALALRFTRVFDLFAS
ncbi:MAG TPA: GNVR domain-containing protein [Pyrinomonadaceae bacterium]|jgi:polysaccharide chain length determinant protein (PEP-CTERM system associated)